MAQLLPGMPSLMNVPGVSSVLSIVNQGLMVADAFNILTRAKPIWGIYFNNAPVIAADSTLSIEVQEEWNVSDYPVEQGGFQTYNKVRRPSQIRITLLKSGSEQVRNAFLLKAKSAAASLDLYTVITPTDSYDSMTIERYSYRRTSERGMQLLRVEFHMRRIVVSATPTAFTNTASVSGLSPVIGGQVQSLSQQLTSQIASTGIPIPSQSLSNQLTQQILGLAH